MASPNRKSEPEASNSQKTSKQSQPPAAETPAVLPDEAGYYEGLRVTTPEKRERFGKAFVHILIATVVFGAGLYLYSGRVQRDEEVHALAVEARSIYLRDNYRDLVEADRLLSEALEKNPRHRYSLATRGLINAYLWHDHGIQDHRQVAEDFTRQAEERVAHLQERYGARALLLLGTNNAVEAERLLVEDVINEGGSGPAIFGSLGLAQRLLGKRTDARASLQRASDAERRTARFNHWIAQMYFDGEELANSTGFIERALDANPDHIFTLILRARNNVARGMDLEATSRAIEEMLERSNRELSPRARALALVAQAELSNARGQHVEAIAAADEALGLVANLPDAHVTKGIAMVGAEQEGSLAKIREGLDMFPHVPRVYHLASRALVAAERFDDARGIMDLWGERVTRNAAYHIAFGNLLLDAQDTTEAKTHYERAIELNPRSAEAFYQLGRIALADESLGEERVATAIEHFNSAIRVRERYPEVYEQMGWIYLDQKAYAEGLRQFVQAINYYQNQNVDREKLHELRQKVGENLARQRQNRLAQMWVQESRELIR